MSYLEIYLEKIRDLLDPSKSNLRVHEDPVTGVYVKGATEVYVTSEEEMVEVMKQVCRLCDRVCVCVCVCGGRGASSKKKRGQGTSGGVTRFLRFRFGGRGVFQGSDNRAVAATGMNQGSSRSHSLFCVSVEQRNTEEGELKTGRLYLVDLAGSEMVRLFIVANAVLACSAHPEPRPHDGKTTGGGVHADFQDGGVWATT